MKYKLIIFLFFLLPLFSWGQDNSLDSLKLALKKSTDDTTRCKLLYKLSETEPDDKLWPIYNKQLNVLCEENLKKYPVNSSLHTFYLKYLATSLNNIGYGYHLQGDIPKAIDYYKKSLKIQEEIHDKSGMANTSLNIGRIYYEQGNLLEALNYYDKSLKISQELRDKKGIANSLNNIGDFYNNMGDLIKALSYYHKSVKVVGETADKELIAISLNNIGSIYFNLKKYTIALDYFNKSLKIQEGMGDRNNVASSLNNIGYVYYVLELYPKALVCFHKSLKINEEINKKEGICESLNSIAEVLLEQGIGINKKDGAKDLAERSLKIAQDLGYPKNIRDVSITLSEIYSKTGNWKGAYQMRVLSKQMKDSLKKETFRKSIIKEDFQKEYNKKIALDKLKAQEERKLINVQLKLKQTQRQVLYGGLILLVGFGGFMFTRFRKEQKQKNIIAKQKNLIVEKNQSINQSIDYALHLQSNILPHYSITDYLPDSFILYQPKDVVSGDFYWLEKKDNNIYIALADCTGHGVPGAFMSMLGTALLNEIFNTYQTKNAAEVLNKLNTLIKQTFKQHLQTHKKINDGMDIAFCILNTQTLELHYASANRPLWMINKNRFLETKANKQAIGGTTPMDYEFANYKIQLQKGDSFYLTSDGYADQFGGEKGKKMMTKVLKQKLEELNNLPMQEQQQQLMSFYNSWKGDNEQVDDVTIIGVKV